MKCHILFSGNDRKNITCLLSAELAQRVVKVKQCYNGKIILYECICNTSSFDFFWQLQL